MENTSDIRAAGYLEGVMMVNIIEDVNEAVGKCQGDVNTLFNAAIHNGMVEVTAVILARSNRHRSQDGEVTKRTSGAVSIPSSHKCWPAVICAMRVRSFLVRYLLEAYSPSNARYGSRPP